MSFSTGNGSFNVCVHNSHSLAAFSRKAEYPSYVINPQFSVVQMMTALSSDNI